MSNPPLAGQVALVTGATGGLGRELAMALATAGANVAILGRDPQRAAATLEAVQQIGRSGLCLLADVTDEARMLAAAQEANAHFGRLDILVAAAGGSTPYRLLTDCDSDDFHRCFSANVLGAALSLKAVLPIMQTQRSGRAILIGGSYGHRGVRGFSLYAAAKWALRGLMKSAALEVGAHNVTVNLVSPGGIEGEKLDRAFAASAARQGIPKEEVMRRFTAETALGRLSTPSDVAAAVIMLAQESGRMITGQDIVVDGGSFR